MSGATHAIHDDLDLLSSYIDGELSEPERRAVEDHVAVCPGCRAELDGLRRVVERLRSLEREAPPPVLAERVARRVAVAGRPTGLVARVERALRRVPVESSTLVIFGVVVALAAITALFVAGLDESDRVRRQGSETVVEREGDLQVLSAHVGDRVLDRDGSLWRERGAGEPVRTVTADSPEAADLFEAEPRLRDLLAGSEGIILLGADGDPLLVRPSG
jgi:anti-sigma factor RsiW